jgi:hypothetical protein
VLTKCVIQLVTTPKFAWVFAVSKLKIIFSSMSNTNTNKRVQFGAPSVVWIPNLAEITPKEKEEIWWSKEEVESFRVNAKEVIRQCPPIFALCLQQASSRHRRSSVDHLDQQQQLQQNGGLDRNLNLWCRYNSQCRGLERMSSSLLRHCAKNRRAALLSKIVRHKAQVLSDEDICHISEKVSAPATRFARQLGKSDALAAWQSIAETSHTTEQGVQRELSGLFAAAMATCS